MQVITAQFDFIKEETRRNPMLTGSGLMNTIDLMLKNDLVLPLVQSSGNEKGVSLMPSYLSKGLEFDGVIAYADPTAPYTERERNLYYVVCTRAQHRLVVFNAPRDKASAEGAR
jgi:DNA helicase-2/ATP-dependent DNA helicase PcrA